MILFRGAILDIDGTFVDTNSAHAQAWVEALEGKGYKVSFEEVLGKIGQGGDKMLPQLIGIQEDTPEGQEIKNRRATIFKEHYLPWVKAFPAAKELLIQMRESGLKLIVASSAQPDELDELLKLFDATDVLQGESSSKDVKHSKPDPDIIEVALDKMGYPANEVVMLGDTAYDIEAASRAGVRTIAFRSGGWKDNDLKGALAIYDGPADLFAHFYTSPLAPGKIEST